MQEIKEVSLGLLEKLDESCRTNGITYYLAYGTLLGAVRHKGFIPWDDDVDVWVPYGQFARLMDRLSTEPGYQVLNYQEGSFWLPFSKFSDARTIVLDRNAMGKAKRRGVSVDIFPLYGCTPKDVWKLRTLAKLHQIMWLLENGHSLMRSEKVISGILKQIGRNEQFWRKQLRELQEKRPDAAEIGNPLSRYRGGTFIRGNALKRPNWFLRGGILSRQQTMIAFCGIYTETICSFPRRKTGSRRIARRHSGYIKNIEEMMNCVLRDLYGDYMQFPPEENQVKMHSV